MPAEREYYHDSHNIMKPCKAPPLSGDPAGNAVAPPEPDGNPVSEKVAGANQPRRPFIAERNGRASRGWAESGRAR